MDPASFTIHASRFHHCRAAEIVVQGFAEEGDEKQIDDRKPYKAAQQDAADTRPPACFIDHFGKTKPFAGCSGENGLEQGIVNEQCTEKEPAEIIISVAPISHVPVMCFVAVVCDNKNEQGIYQEIQDPGSVADRFHGAKVRRVWGLGFGVWGLGFGVWGLGFGV